MQFVIVTYSRDHYAERVIGPFKSAKSALLHAKQSAYSKDDWVIRRLLPVSPAAFQAGYEAAKPRGKARPKKKSGKVEIEVPTPTQKCGACQGMGYQHGIPGPCTLCDGKGKHAVFQ